MTRDELQTRLNNYLAAEAKILQSQEYAVGQGSTARRQVRADLEAVQRGIKDTRAELAVLDGVTSRGRRVVYLRPY